jgi:hypothetical protein
MSTLQGALDKCDGVVGTNVGKERFQAAADAGKVRFNRFRVDMSTLESDVIAVGFGCWVDRQVMEFVKGEV